MEGGNNLNSRERIFTIIKGDEADRCGFWLGNPDIKGQIAFMGGIDTQELLVDGSPDGVRRGVERVKALLGPNPIVSPSHEALLPDISPENVQAIARAVA
jgi:hypothetical protein